MQIIRYYSKREFRKVRKKNQEIRLVGQTKLSKWKDKYLKDKDCRKLVDLEQKEAYVVRPKIWGLQKKFIRVSLDEYVVVKYKMPLLIPIFFLAMICLLSMNFKSDNPSGLAEILIGGQEIEEYHPQYAYEEEMIEIPGLLKEYTINENNREIYLVNPESNTVYFKYTIFLKDGQTIYESDYIPPNQMVKADLYERLEKGGHELHVLVESIDMETHSACNSAQLNTKIFVI